MSNVEVRTSGAIGELVLCNPAALNALTHEDLKALTAGLASHEADPGIRAIVIRSDSARAFCAGGDMKQIYADILAERFEDIRGFFVSEYGLNLAISRCTKPYIALMNGITMGGGLGVSVHGSVRVATETSVLAMPESRIGFFPDVGASFFLPALKERAGYWLGLTAAPVRAHEAVSVGLATHFVSSEKLEQLQSSLNTALQDSSNSPTSDAHQIVTNTLDSFHQASTDTSFTKTLEQRKAWFADSSLDGIRQRLLDAARQEEKDAQHLLTLLDAGSPHSSRITLDLFEKTVGMNLQQCLEVELALCGEAVRHPDCAEGIRAVLVDKDRNPHWQE